MQSQAGPGLSQPPQQFKDRACPQWKTVVLTNPWLALANEDI